MGLAATVIVAALMYFKYQAQQNKAIAKQKKRSGNGMGGRGKCKGGGDHLTAHRLFGESRGFCGVCAHGHQYTHQQEAQKRQAQLSSYVSHGFFSSFSGQMAASSTSAATGIPDSFRLAAHSAHISRSSQITKQRLQTTCLQIGQ